MAKNIEARLTALETEMTRLRELVEGKKQKKGWRAIVGTFANDPLYEKAMKYGREYRESLRPGSKKKKRNNGNS